MSVQEKLYGTAAALAARNPRVPQGAVAAESDTGVVKIGDGVTRYTSLPEAHNSTYATVGAAQPRLGRRLVLGGDSITAGTGATNATTSAYVAMTQKIVGGAKLGTTVNGGTAGDKAADLLARMSALLVGVDAVHIQIGTNDCGVTSLASFQASIQAIKNKCDVAGKPMSIGTIPPRATGASTAIKDDVKRFNLWIRFWAQAHGVPVADVHSALVDRTTGGLAAANDSGDGIHPNDTGHLAAAVAVAAAVSQILQAIAWPVVAAGNGLLLNPVPTTTAQWGVQAGPGTALSSIVAPGAGELPAGSWLRWTLDNTGGSSGTSTFGAAIQTPWTAGDVLLMCCYYRGSSTTALNKLSILNGSGLAQLAVLMTVPPSATPGPLMAKFTVPSGPTSLLFCGIIGAGSGTTTTFDIGAVDVFNLTTAGIDPALV